MPPYTTATDFRADLLARATAAQRRASARQFPGDATLAGVRMGDVFVLAKSALDLPVDQIELLLSRTASTRCAPAGARSWARRRPPVA